MEKGRRETQKEFRRLVLGEFFLAKGEENKRYSTLLFSRFGKPENFRKTFAKEKEEEEEEDVRRDSKVVKEYVKSCLCCKLYVKLIEKENKKLDKN